MTWLASIAALIWPRSASSSPAPAGTAPTTGASGPANPVFHSQRSGGKPTSDFAALIARRAQRTCNRKASLASIYENKHMILGMGVGDGRV